MRYTRWIATLSALCAALLVMSCEAASPTGVAPSVGPPDTELFGGPPSRLTLLECSPLPADTSVALIGPAGGTILVGPHRFVVPEGALDSAVTITAIAPTGTINRVQFSPDGLQFARSTVLTMSYANCGVLTWLIPRRIVHIDGNLNILEILPSLNNILNRTVSARLDHFSDYAVAW